MDHAAGARPGTRYLAGDGTLWAWLARAVGRLIFGPIVAVATLVREEARQLRRAPNAVIRDWLPHLATVAVIVGWLKWTGFGIGRYLLLVVYPGTALTLLRPFAKHHADLRSDARAATVERGGLLGLIFLNNHFHAARHERPDLA